jgi:hypothetical protein
VTVRATEGTFLAKSAHFDGKTLVFTMDAGSIYDFRAIFPPQTPRYVARGPSLWR